MSEVTSSQTVSGSGSPVIVEEENRYRDTEIVDTARTLELSDEEAERLMPQPTTKVPWFGYDSLAEYGDDGWDAVADNSTGDRSSGGRAPAAKASDAASDDGSKSDGGRSPSAAVSDPSDGPQSPGCGLEIKEGTVEVGGGVIPVSISITVGPKDDSGSGGDPSVGDSRHSK